MSEQHPANQEAANRSEHLPDHSRDYESDGPSDAAHEAARQNALETSRQQIDREAKTSESMKIVEASNESAPQPNVDKELKAMAYGRLISRARRQLPGPDKLFSRIIHQPVIDKVSQLGEKTIARPSGIMGGGIIALAGTSLLLYTAKRYGFRYNFLAFALLFVVGFVIGILFELLLKLKKSRG